MFGSRTQSLHSWKQYECAKILDTLWDTVTLEQLNDMGIRVVRGQYKDGLECIGFWRNGAYTRIVHDPKASLRSIETRTAYGAVPCIDRQKFESLEAVMLPYKYFRTYAHMTRSFFFATDRVSEYRQQPSTLNIYRYSMGFETFQTFCFVFQ